MEILTPLQDAVCSAKDLLYLKLKEYVQQHGDDCTDYEVHQFGLDEEEGKVTKVLNFFDNGGCCFFEPDQLNSDKLEDINEKNYNDKLYENVTFSAYLCLYIVEYEDGTDELKAYRFYNGGVSFDDDQSEPDHTSAYDLTLLDLHYICLAINVNFTD